MDEDTLSLDPADAILTRRFELDDGHVDVYVWAPQIVDDNFTRCDYQIVGLGSGKPRYGGGIDGIQALTAALSAINSYLYYYFDAWKEGRLTWLGRRDLGVPGLPGDRPLEGGYGQAQLLTTVGWQAVVQMPDTPMPYVAWSDEHLANNIRNLKAVLEDMETSPQKARTHLTRIIDGLLEEKS